MEKKTFPRSWAWFANLQPADRMNIKGLFLPTSDSGSP